jgi:rod shape-determining protein MreC
VPAFGPDRETNGGRRQGIIAAVLLLVALAVYSLPEAAQQSMASSLRASVLRPFLATQERLVEARLSAREVGLLQGQLDTLTAEMATYRALADENRTLRTLLELSDRLGPSFHPASVLRPGDIDSESMFLVDLGTEDGVAAGAPIVDRHGLVGVVREVRPTTSVAMDWTHPDFRASAMLADGSAYGIVEPRRGAFREDDRLILNGTAFFEDFPEDMPVLTSGFGGMFPRGIPIGAVESVAETEGQWRKSYWLRPMVQPSSVTHVLVQLEGADPERTADRWPDGPLQSREEFILGLRTTADSLAALGDSVRILRSLLEEARARDTLPRGGLP